MEPNLEDISVAVEVVKAAEKEERERYIQEHPEAAAAVVKKPREIDEETATTEDFRIPLWKELLLAGRTGAGMFVESYMIFAVGNIGSIWKYLYPTCYSSTASGSACNAQSVIAVPYVEIAGIIAGMIGFGLLADHLGRLWGSRCTSGLMLLGGIMTVVSNGVDLTGLFVMFNISIFIFSLGVGGEYPMASSTASERSEAEKLARGRTVIFTFACQGWGNFINSCVICLLLVITSTGDCSAAYLSANGHNGACNSPGLEVVWRVQYALAIPVIAWLFWLRLCKLRESQIWKKRQASFKTLSKRDIHKKRVQDARMLYSKTYLPRLIGAAGTWFVWDVAFYGNKLFQGKIIAVIVGNPQTITLQNVLNITVLNSGIALVGYYFAAFTIDKKWMGRVRMQNMGFLVTAVLFLICGYLYDSLVKPELIGLFQFLYLMSSFFAQWGANATTWLLPVELFPTDIRSQAHGICAATGKLGALTATLIFSFANAGNPVTAQLIFQISGYCCLAGLVLTIMLVPDFTGIPLSKVDEDWNQLMGRKSNISLPRSGIETASEASGMDARTIGAADPVPDDAEVPAPQETQSKTITIV